jgi:hypothetical protein
MDKKADASSLVVGLDIIGFALVLVGAAMIRYAKDELFTIIGGFVMAGGVAVLSITRLVKK